jgi:hypothetical protein
LPLWDGHKGLERYLPLVAEEIVSQCEDVRTIKVQLQSDADGSCFQQVSPAWGGGNGVSVPRRGAVGNGKDLVVIVGVVALDLRNEWSNGIGWREPGWIESRSISRPGKRGGDLLPPRIPKENLAYNGLLCVGTPGSLHLIESEERKPPYEGEERNGHQDIDEAKAPLIHESILSGRLGDKGYKTCTISLSK